MTQRNTLVAALITLAALIGVGDAPAQTASLRDSPLVKACGADLRKHCRTVSPGQGRALACLQAQGSQLSTTCKAELPRLARCSQEAQRLCGDVASSQGRTCLGSQRDRFSEECRQLAPR
jgi:Cysteine rich repeat